MPRKKASIQEVAEAAGVSLTTVSHALNHVASARVAEATRQRVREAAERLGYRPSRLARGLRMQRTNTIALLSDHIATTPQSAPWSAIPRRQPSFLAMGLASRTRLGVANHVLRKSAPRPAMRSMSFPGAS